MLGLGFGNRGRMSTPLRVRRVNWVAVAPYGFTVAATLAIGWALSQLG